MMHLVYSQLWRTFGHINYAIVHGIYIRVHICKPGLLNLVVADNPIALTQVPCTLLYLYVLFYCPYIAFNCHSLP